MARDAAEVRSIMAQTAYKCASWIHAAEVQTGAVPDAEHLFDLARKIANGIVKLGGPSTVAGGSSPQPSPRVGEAAPPTSSAPSCPHCNEPMEFNEKWTGYDKKPKWRCSMRGKFIKDKGWTGCDGARWEDREGAA